jgi:hypothetical protein
VDVSPNLMSLNFSPNKLSNNSLLLKCNYVMKLLFVEVVKRVSGFWRIETMNVNRIVQDQNLSLAPMNLFTLMH